MLARLIRRFVFVLLSAVLAVSTALAADPKRNLAVAKTTPAATEQRVALVIGNSSYKSAPLANPVNDARAISAKLRTLGFEVIERQNLTQKQVGSVLREFRSKLKPGGVALFFYAGHGLQVKGVNYLPTVDADIASEEDVPTQSLDANKVLELMDEAKTRMNLVFLDACRNNPYARSFRSAADGLAKVNAPSGTIISFATRPGSVAADAGSGRNGLYTEHLLAAMDLPNTAIEQALKRVVSGVKQASKGRQEPWMEGSIEGDFYFKPGQAGGAVPAVRPPPPVRVQTPEEVEQELWSAIKTSRDKRDIEDYLKQYPKGRFAPLAHQKLKALADAPAPSKPTTTVAAIAPAPATKPKPEPAQERRRQQAVDEGRRKLEGLWVCADCNPGISYEYRLSLSGNDVRIYQTEWCVRGQCGRTNRQTFRGSLLGDGSMTGSVIVESSPGGHPPAGEYPATARISPNYDEITFIVQGSAAHTPIRKR